TFDCEKASSTAKIALNLKYSKQVGVVGVIPIGDFHYFRGGLTPHSINILMVVDNKDNLKLVFFEPQTQEFISLSLVEQFMRLRMIF
ncbi:MAG: hypothetical protein Q8O88_00595, partial [bacterium]|nr:hypothetical protein [bacterium]